MTSSAAGERRLGALDGWRAISILSVLACHMLALGPKGWKLNETSGSLGMVLFFNLSGFLITSALLESPKVWSFYIRRGCRILPLAWLFIPVALFGQGASARAYLEHLGFVVNYDPDRLTTLTSPLWSLCVEVHFYIFVGLVVALLGRRGLFALPLICVAVTATRIWQQVPISLLTHLRVDEILAGATLALVHRAPKAAALRSALSLVPLVALILVMLACCHPDLAVLNYVRPYLGAMAIGHTLWRRGWLTSLLESRPMRYLADVSYALYVIHPIMRLGWLGSGGGWERYLLRRPVGFAITFALAHLSTFYYEKYWIKWGKSRAAPRHAAPVLEASIATP